ncbi:MAG: transposase [Alphaproteobacteria bacterium]
MCKTWPWVKLKQVVADKGYDTGPVRRLIRDHGAQPVIPPKGIYALPGSHLKPSDCYDVKTYRERH